MTLKKWKVQLQLKQMDQVRKKSAMPTSPTFHFNHII